MLFQFTLNNIPKQILHNISRSLDPKEVATLQTTSKPLCTHASSSTIWLPYLKRLKAIDNEISVTPPKENQESWCYRRFVEGFKEIAQSQHKKIQSFRDARLQTPLITGLLLSFDAYAPQKTLKALENKHAILKELDTQAKQYLRRGYVKTRDRSPRDLCRIR